VLHVATHGFFLTPGRSLDAGSSEFGVGGWTGAERSVSADNPLLLSGLVLAGANSRLTADVADAEDGLLVAEEIASLDLRGVEWAVLSACETAVGEFVPGEGIVGLQRAALGAGVRTVVMSLWRVDDAATRDWIEHLYRARLARRSSTIEAVRQANRDVIAARRSAKSSTHPFYWGAFVAAGDWR
jgi:CHAT domain-containing protein